MKLFRRSNHNIVLTEDGMILKRRAQELLTLAEKTKRDFLHRGEQLEGTIAIGSGEFLATRCLTDCIAAFHRMHPLVRYELVSGNAGNLLDQIERGLLDLALLAEPIDIRKYDFVAHAGFGRMGRTGAGGLGTGPKGQPCPAGSGRHSPDLLPERPRPGAAASLVRPLRRAA